MLMERGQQTSDTLVVTIFVNPTQFAPGEDLATYPRDVDGDLAICREAGAHAVFVPEVAELYPEGFETHVDVEKVSQGLCGASRPGHFRGVCTIVAKLFNIVGPCCAVFGEKDYQQLQVIRRMVRDLNFPVTIESCETARDADGVAISSRNARLSDQERIAARSIYRALSAFAVRVANGEILQRSVIKDEFHREVEGQPGIRVQYVDCVDPETLAPTIDTSGGPTVVAAAVFVGRTRLIDNIRLGTSER